MTCFPPSPAATSNHAISSTKARESANVYMLFRTREMLSSSKVPNEDMGKMARPGKNMKTTSRKYLPAYGSKCQQRLIAEITHAPLATATQIRIHTQSFMSSCTAGGQRLLASTETGSGCVHHWPVLEEWHQRDDRCFQGVEVATLA